MTTMFSMGDADAFFAARIREALSSVEDEDLATLEERLPETIDRVSSVYALKPIELGEAKASTEDVTIRPNRFGGAGFHAPGQNVDRAATRVTITLPFTGSGELLRYRPQTFDLLPVETTVRSSSVDFSRDFVQPQTNEVKAWRDGELERLRQRIANANAAVSAFNDRLKAQVAQAAEGRRRRLQSQKSLKDELNRD
jgi:hypothetical protein